MSKTTATPAGPAPVWDVINGFTSYWALSAALDLGLFDALAEDADSATGLDAAQLATAIGAAGPGQVTVLAETLVALGLLSAAEDRFRLTPTAERYLVSTAPASMAALVRYSPGPPAAWPGLADTIRTGAPEPAVTAGLAELYPALVRATGPTQAGVATAVAAELERRGLWPEQPTVVDLGCGSGAWLTALLRTRPAGTVIAVDRPNVLPIAERAATDVGLREQVIAVAGDYLGTALPVAAADVVVLAHVLRAEPAERARQLLARAVELAGAGGVVVVVDYPRPDPARARHDDGDVRGEDRVAACVAARHELLLSLTMLASTAGLGVTVADLRAWAEAAGAELVDSFEPLPRQHVHLIRSRTPEATS
ncbi:class I SAM-dependent methyltransferase [Streptomyces sp. AC555_RSS877]|uniref:class I SAM-dependent methyltransferase n=1 Tax=Streptomyces sp. AC555_RSS877 TaxID=2823688 RepID=UPI001C27D333|nr:class I SAM-dependent methyltransferase [Streptomyces sp. AC555_RSS877]